MVERKRELQSYPVLLTKSEGVHLKNEKNVEDEQAD